MSIVNRTKEDNRRFISRILREQGVLTDLTPGSALGTIVDIIVDRVDDLFDQLALASSMVSISTASGMFLDMKGAEKGLNRRAPVKAKALASDKTQKIYVTSGFVADWIPSRIIPAGTQFSNDDGSVVYESIEDIGFLSTDREVFVSIRAIEPGTAFNVGANSLTSHSLNIPQIFTTNIKSIVNGLDAETDDAYRFRILSTGNATTPGSVRAILNASFSDPSVSDAVVRRHIQGVGTFGVELTPVGNDVPTSSIRNITNQVFNVMSYGNRAVIFSAFPLTISIIATIRTSTALNDAQRVGLARTAETAIASSISSIPKGGEIVINRLIADVIDSSSDIIDAKIVSMCIDGEEQAIRDFKLERDEFLRLDDTKARSVQVFF